MSDATTDVVSKNVESEAEANENATTTSANDSVNQVVPTELVTNSLYRDH